MAYVFNMVGGGGGSPYASIGVSYPAGKICECTNGADTLQAKVESYNGDIVTFQAEEAVPLRDVDVDITAQQDLNGYDHPWAGGAGKNKLPTNSYENKTRNELNTTFAVEIANIVVGSTDNFVISGRTTAVQADSNVISIFVEYLDGTTESKNIYRGSEHSSGLIAGDWNMPLTKGKEITNVRIGGNTGSARCTLTNLQLESGSTATAYAPYSNICPISGWSDVKVYREAQYDAGATPYATINLNGTVYGGSLDVTTGVLTVDRAIIDLSSLTWTLNPDTGANANVSAYGIKPVASQNVLPNLMASNYSVVTRNQHASAIIDGTAISLVSQSNNGSYIYVGDASFTPTGQLVYELATPITVQLTAQQIDTLVGQNVIYADTGDVSVEYTSGYWIFPIKANGTWTVSCDSQSQTVVIDKPHQFEAVYFKSSAIFDQTMSLDVLTANIQYGNDYRYGVITKNANDVFVFTASSSGSTNHERCWQWKTQIDCSLYRKLRIIAKVSTTGKDSYFGLGSALVTGTSATATHASTGVAEKIINNASDYDTYEIDISNLSSELYIGLRTTYTSEFHVKTIELVY